MKQYKKAFVKALCMTPLSFFVISLFCQHLFVVTLYQKIYCALQLQAIQYHPKGLCQGEEHSCEQERFRTDQEIKETCKRWGAGECEHFLKMFVYPVLDTHVSLEEFATFISLQKSASKEPIRHIQPTKSKVVEDALLYLLSF